MTRFRCSVASILILTLAWSACGRVAEPTLEQRLTLLTRDYRGKVAIAVKHLDGGPSYFLNADQPMPAAGLIQLPIMLEVYQQAAEGKVKLTELLKLQDADKVPGSGILAEHFSSGASFSLRDAVRLMIVYSDQTAANLVLDQIGIAATNQRMQAWGLRNTKVYAKASRNGTTSIDLEATKRFGLGSTTAREMVTLLEDLNAGSHFPPAMKQAVLCHLRHCDDRDKFSRLLPECPLHVEPKQ